MALLVKPHARKHSEGVKAFLEESIVRRELADNFCFYQPNCAHLSDCQHACKAAPAPAMWSSCDRASKAHVRARDRGLNTRGPRRRR